MKLFNTQPRPQPTAKEIAQHDLEEARRRALEHALKRDEHKHMHAYYEETIARLEAYLGHAKNCGQVHPAMNSVGNAAFCSAQSMNNKIAGSMSLGEFPRDYGMPMNHKKPEVS